MDQEDRRNLEHTLSLAKDNNRMLKKLHRAMRWSRFFRLIYLVIIIAASVGAYYYVQPYLEQVSNAYNGFKGTLQNINEAIPGR
jgi:hypothetical protein